MGQLICDLSGLEMQHQLRRKQTYSIKRTIATNEGWQLNVITGTQIHQNIDLVYKMMEDYFTYN